MLSSHLLNLPREGGISAHALSQLPALPILLCDKMLPADMRFCMRWLCDMGMGAFVSLMPEHRAYCHMDDQTAAVHAG